MTGLASDAWEKIERFHVFLERWLRGDGEPARRRIEEALAPFDAEFLAIDPGGNRQTRDQLIRWLEESWGRDPSLSIRLAKPELLWEAEGAALLGYQEHQEGRAPSSRRAITLFHSRKGFARWVHLSETWTSGS